MKGDFIMTAFLEEYGKVIVVIVVIGALVILASYFKNKGREAAQQNFDAYTGMATELTNDAIQEAKDNGNGG